MKSLAECRLYAFIDRAYLHGRSPALLARQLCAGGADLIQLRAKGTSADEVRNLASEIHPILRDANVGLVINDHPQLALQLGADLCHLGQEDFFDPGHTRVEQLWALPPPAASPPTLPEAESPRLGVSASRRRSEPPGVGLSTHAPEQARRALAAQPAYIAIGPVFPTGTKPEARPVTLDYVRWAAANVPTPWFAIGGITLSNLAEVLAAGARRVCVVSAILNAPDPAEACREFKRRLA